ncbi:MAG: formylglycine-generating enzyme family protein [Prevotella sp.]|nr:formylglycine-generating enzyme family protein [Prevotella sp.]
MIVGEWVLESNSGTPRVLTFTDDGYYTDSYDGGTKKHPWRLSSDYSDGQPYYGGIYLDGVYYDIVSWGDGHWRLKDRNGKIFDFSRDGGTDNNGNNNDPDPDDGKYETKTYTVNSVSFKMIAVAGGTFTMGATSEQGSDVFDVEKPAHKVTLSSFSIGQTEVTQELWQAVMGSNPSSFKGAKLPVEEVSWNDCQTFIAKLNQLTGKQFRLPTEAEWEYAARGGRQSKGYKYAGSNTLGDVAWYEGNSSPQTHDVATKQPNELGLYDMSGNVWEWCQDWCGSYSGSTQTNPTGPASGSYRVVRGGGWYSSARYCRVSYRDGDSPGHRNYIFGLRIAL